MTVLIEETAGAPQLAGRATAASSPNPEVNGEAEVPVADGSTHELNAPVSERTYQRMVRYHRHQRAFMEEFLFTPVAKYDELEFWKLFETGPHQPGDNDNVRIEKTANFERAAGIVRRNPDFRPSDRLRKHLRRTIRNRERAQRWYSRLHPMDKRSGRHQVCHVDFVDILKRVYRTLSDGRAYSPARRHRKQVRRWQAMVVKGSMLGER